MITLYEQQQQLLLAEKLRVLRRIQDGLRWSLQRLPELDGTAMNDPAVAERGAAIVDRFCKLQDQLAGVMRHVHAMLGERQRNFQDVVTWAISDGLLEKESTWLELRSLRNRLTHEYDPGSDELPDLMILIRQGEETPGRFHRSLFAALHTAWARAIRGLGRHMNLARNAVSWQPWPSLPNPMLWSTLPAIIPSSPRMSQAACCWTNSTNDVKPYSMRAGNTVRGRSVSLAPWPDAKIDRTATWTSLSTCLADTTC